ncbi:hypothetical protein CSKR_111864 [Clonorchis sinensis]|uniref:Uncharacterized protein n=1 Tax=Clonorchis sinensis TaxID=79923 RepID=A0A419PUZ8_CLOSI|nr:hypothetical protein CSKR_111864 [Clonorchis sinensis]
MKEITRHLGAVGATRLPGWGPHDPHFTWLETLRDKPANRRQWLSCCQFLSGLPESVSGAIVSGNVIYRFPKHAQVFYKLRYMSNELGAFSPQLSHLFVDGSTGFSKVMGAMLHQVSWFGEAKYSSLSLSLKGCVYQATALVVLLYGCENWPVGEAELSRLHNHSTVFVTRQVESEFTVVHGNFHGRVCPAREAVLVGHVLRMLNHRLPKRVLFFVPKSELRKQRGGQPLTWQRVMKEITRRLGAVGATRLLG